MKRLFFLSMTFFLCLAIKGLIIPPLSYAKTTFVTIGTGGITGVYYPTGGAIAKIVNKKRKEYGIRCTVESTGGSVFNVNAIMSGDLEFGVVQSDRQFQAMKGLAEWKDKGPQKDLRAVFSIYPESITLVAAVDAGIKDITDLRGKRVNIGNPGSGQRQNSIDALTAVGIDYKKDMQAEGIKAAESAGLLQDGRIDAFFYTVGHPSGSIKEATSGKRKVRFVAIPVVDKLLAKYPYYAKTKIPVALYPGAENKEDVQTFGVKATFVTSAKVPDDVVYAITKLVFDNFEDFKKLHPAYQNLTKRGMLEGLSAPIHPGALKYYKEQRLGKIEKSPQLFWNAWPEDGRGPRFKPVTSLKPNANYRLSLDLAALKYRAAGAIAAPTMQSFSTEVANWLEPGMPPPDLKVLLLADPAKFKTDPTVKPIIIHLDNLRRVWRNGFVRVDDDHFLILQKAYDAGRMPDFKFGGIYFDVQTLDREGPAAVAFSIWHKDRPIDEVSIQLCIAESPESEQRECGTLKDTIPPQGLLSVRAASGSSGAPTAAIHFVSLGQDEKINGVFREKKWPQDKFLVWQIDQTAERFRQTISEEFLKDIAAGSTDKNLLVRGETLFNHLFPREATSFDGRKVHEDILNFLRPYLQKDPSARGYRLPSIFFRMIQVGPSPSLPLPLGLLAVRVEENKEMTRENGRFIGEYFLIEAPLEVQTYKTSKECLSRWVMVLPPEDTGDYAINNALLHLGLTIDGWCNNEETMTFNRMNKFMDWLYRLRSAQEEDPPTTLVTLSHHDRNSLYFYKSDSDKDNPLRSSMINRKFAQPSVAILNGCGTGGEGAVELIRRFNRNGFSTVIATSTEIEGSMAGAFLNVFADEISKSDPMKHRTLGLAYWRTLQRLSQTKPIGIIGAKPFGAKVLRFSLLGNGNVLLCAPRKENRPLADQ